MGSDSVILRSAVVCNSVADPASSRTGAGNFVHESFLPFLSHPRSDAIMNCSQSACCREENLLLPEHSTSMLLTFPDLDSLHLAITAQVVPDMVCRAAVQVVFEDDGRILL